MLKIRNIFSLFVASQEGCPSFFKRAVAVYLDVIFTTLLRSFFFHYIAKIWLLRPFNDFVYQLQTIYGPENEKIFYFSSYWPILNKHELFYYIIFIALIFLIIGALYYAILYSSSWQASFGKRIMNIIIVKTDGTRLTFTRGLVRYCVSIIPWLVALGILLFALEANQGLGSFLNENRIILLPILMVIIWFESFFFNKNRRVIHDFVCDSVVKKGKRGTSLITIMQLMLKKISNFVNNFKINNRK